ncbi:MAG: hypothetical protein U5J63_00590 [Fodinibius sp.]|nr:hypothetical protein [Fodinibius sp.]
MGDPILQPGAYDGGSGSIVTTLDEEAVGLLFAGSPYVTVLNNILYVQSLLNIRIHEK